MSDRPQNLSALTGLRFVAAFVIFVHHLRGRFGIPHFDWNLGPAVSFFFVLSGFILTYVYANRLTKQTVTKFLVTRCARIWPLHVVCLMLSGLVLFDQVKGHSLWNWLLSLGLLQSWAGNIQWSMSINAPAWSISTEMFFYLAFPILLLGSPKRFWLCFVGLLVFVFVSLRAMQVLESVDLLGASIQPAAVIYTNPLFRLSEFVVGIITARIFLRHSTSRTNFAASPNLYVGTLLELASVLSIALYYVWFRNWGGASAIYCHPWLGPLLANWFSVCGSSITFAALIYVFALRRGILSQLTGSRSMVYLGELSFAFYLVHTIWIRRLDELIAPHWLSPFIGVSACLALTLLFSAMLYRMVELPSKKWILNAYENGLKRSLLPLVGSCGRVIARPSFMICGLLVIATVYAWSQWNVYSTKQLITRIVNETPAHYRNVHFTDEATLLGFESQCSKHALTIRMVWRLKADRFRRRFMHVCDDAGNILFQASQNPYLFATTTPDQVIVDKVHIAKDRLSQASKISIGYFDPETGCVVVQSGPRSMNNRRLDLMALSTKNRSAVSADETRTDSQPVFR